MIKRTLPLMLLVLLLLSACGNESQDTGGDAANVTPPVLPTEEPEAVASPTPEPPTATATVAMPPGETDGSDPTPTPPPPPTATPTLTPTPLPQPPAGLAFAPVVDGFQRPLYVTHAGDERLFVVEQNGQIRVVAGGQLLPTPFLDIGNRITTAGNEQGLLGLAFHPEYATNGEFYVNYSRAADGATVVARYRVTGDPNVADPGSEEILFTIGQPYPNHNGGAVVFGPDGYLYIGMGDGGSQGDPQNNGQRKDTLLGAMLRIDVDGGEPYAIPGDNPFVADAEGRNEIWSIGFRNPWRFSFDRQTGDLWMADVGQNLWEEVNWEAAGHTGGANYGWNILEGTHCYVTADCDPGNTVLPVSEYNHTVGGCSVTGGYVYRGDRFPALQGNYLYGDYCTGIIWSVTPQADGGWTTTRIVDTDFIISSFGEGNDGELYLVDQQSGTIFAVETP